MHESSFKHEETEMCSHSGNYCTPISTCKGKEIKAGRNTRRGNNMSKLTQWTHFLHFTLQDTFLFSQVVLHRAFFLSIIELYWKFNLYYCFCTTFHNTLEVLHLGSRPLHEYQKPSLVLLCCSTIYIFPFWRLPQSKVAAENSIP